jgi:hypothetical protein
MFTVDELKLIRASMTWGDQAYGKEQAGDDADGTVKHAMHRAARRLGLSAPDTSVDDFLDNVRMDDLSTALDENRSPTSADTAT